VAVLPLVTFPNAILRERARRVRTIDKSILRLAHDMIDTMHHHNGVGLAANQVGVLRRVIVVQLPDDEEPRIYINPEIVHREGERLVDEGCLSVPGYVGTIPRAIWVRFRALDSTSKLVRLKADGLLAQALEHEVDHINGILYLDHLQEHEQLRPVEAEAEDGREGSEVEPERATTDVHAD